MEQFLGSVTLTRFHYDNMPPATGDGKRKVAFLDEASLDLFSEINFAFFGRHSRQPTSSRYSCESRATLPPFRGNGVSARKPNRKANDEETTTEHSGGR